jgi:hypothetical protein
MSKCSGPALLWAAGAGRLRDGLVGGGHADPCIFRAAKLLINQHGAEAALRAAQRADELLKDGDDRRVGLWGRILAAVKELRRGRREGEALN